MTLVDVISERLLGKRIKCENLDGIYEGVVESVTACVASELIEIHFEPEESTYPDENPVMICEIFDDFEIIE